MAQSLVVLLIVAFAAFALCRQAGDRAANLIAPEATVADREALIAELRLDDPIPVEFARYLGGAVSGDFGTSLRHARPVGALIAARLPATLELALVSGALSITFGVALGAAMAAHRPHRVLRALFAAAFVAGAVPTFLTGILLIWFFAVELRWLPAFGRGEVAAIGRWQSGLVTFDGLRSLVLPALTLAVYQTTTIMRLVRAETVGALAADHITFARARGLPEWRIVITHALPNVLAPVMTIVGLQIGSLIAFAFVTERVFQWPGVGLLLIESIEFVDVPVVAACLMLVALTFLSVNLVIDIACAACDPRILEAQRTARPVSTS